MSKSAKGTEENLGRKIKAKSVLNHFIPGQDWYEFRRQLEYELLWKGGHVLTVDPKYTSQTYPSCNHVARENRLA